MRYRIESSEDVITTSDSQADLKYDLWAKGMGGNPYAQMIEDAAAQVGAKTSIVE